MEILYSIGISEEEILDMIRTCNSIKDLDEEEIKEKIELLKAIGCQDKHIRNILVSNPFYLDRLTIDIINLIKRLKQLGFTTIYLLLDSNPFILDRDVYEIDNYIKERLEQNEELEDIVDNLDSNPYLFNEM